MARLPPSRGVVMTLLMTLLFHVFSLLNGLLLVALLVLTLGGVGLVLLCVLSASTRTSRVFVAWLWRNELWINGLVGEKQTEDERLQQERDRGLRREASQRTNTSSGGFERVPSTSSSTLPTAAPTTNAMRQSSTRGREVTASVMTFSVMYFLLFKGLFNIMFSAVPLLLWSLAVLQVVPSAAPQKDMVLASDTGGSIFVALASSFFAYQIGVVAASASVALSEKIQGLLFHRDTASVRAPLLATDSFRHGDTYPEYESMQRDNVLPQAFLDENRYGDDLRQRAMDRPPRPVASTSSSGREMSGGGNSAPPFPPPPPPPPPGPHPMHAFQFPPMPRVPPFPPGSSQRRPRPNQYEDAFRAEPTRRDIEFCGIKVSIQSDNDGEDQDDQGHHGGGRGGSGRGGFGHRGGRGGRGHGGSDRAPFVEFTSRIEMSDSPRRSSRQPFRFDEPTVFASVVENGSGFPTEFPPTARPVPDARSLRDSPRSKRRKTGGRLRRSDSFDSGQHTGGGYPAPDFDLKHGAHTRLWEALDLRPSAPGFPTEAWRFEDFPMARPTETHAMDAAPLSGGLYKSLSDRGHKNPYAFADDADTSMGSRKLEMFAMKQMLKEQSRQMKREYKAQWKREARALKARLEEQERYICEQERMARDEERAARDQERLARDQERYVRDQQRAAQAAQRGRSGSDRHVAEAEALRAMEQQRKYQTAQADPDEGKRATARVDEASATDREREHEIHAMDIEKAAQEEVERQRRELIAASTASSDPSRLTVRTASGSGDLGATSSSGSSQGPRTRGRRQTTSGDLEVQSFQARRDDITVESVAMRTGRSTSRKIDISNPYQTGAPDFADADQEIRLMYGETPRTNDVMGLVHQYGGISLPNSPALIQSIDTGPVYRSTMDNGSPREYNAFSPLHSPASSSFLTSSFLDSGGGGGPVYDALSPTNSPRDAHFSSEEFEQQVYRSIRFTDENRVAPSQLSALPHYEDVPGPRDKVHFCAYAPPSVCPAKKPFRFAVWAFLLNQRRAMREQAEVADPTARQMSMDTKMVVRRGALVHVTLEVPEGFRVLNGATQGFPWEGKIAHVDYDIECTDHAGFGQVLFKASIVVGTEVAVLRSFVMVSGKQLTAGDMDAMLLESELEVLEMTYTEIPYPTLELQELVGSGYFGDAYRARVNGEDVVVKTIRASEFGETSDQILKEFQHEAAVLSMFGHHPCVVPFVGASTDLRYPLSLITKYLPHGSLEDSLKKPEARTELSTRQRTLMLKDAAAGLLNVHEGGFIHRDIAARNCLVGQDLRVKICDFGLCRRVNAYGGSLMKDSVGPIKYMAPESLQPPHSFSFDSDAWMFGVLMWETYTATPPFQGKTPLEAGMGVLRGERLPMPQDLPEELQLLMEACFHETPSQRPSMAEILTSLDDWVAPHASAKAAAASPGAAVAAPRSSLALAYGRAELERRDRSIWV